jgi:hypothetical protein
MLMALVGVPEMAPVEELRDSPSGIAKPEFQANDSFPLHDDGMPETIGVATRATPTFPFTVSLRLPFEFHWVLITMLASEEQAVSPSPPPPQDESSGRKRSRKLAANRTVRFSLL